MNELTINNTSIQVKEYNGQHVVTFKDIDAVHSRPDGTASRNFRANKNHFIEYEDFYKITPDEFRRTFGDMDKRQQNDITLITETGYLMLVKSFKDDLAWDVQRMLVNTYFKKYPVKTEFYEKAQNMIYDVKNKLMVVEEIINGMSRYIEMKEYKSYASVAKCSAVELAILVQELADLT